MRSLRTAQDSAHTGCSSSPFAPSYASAAAVDVLGAEDVGVASTSGKRRSGKGKGGRGGGGGSRGGGGGSSGGGGGGRGGGSSGSGGGSGGSGSGGGGSGGSGGSGSGGSGGGRTGAQRGELLRSSVEIFDLDYDALLSAMYALFASAEGDCYQCVPPDPGIAAAALGASASGTPPSTAPAEALHTFTLDSGASRCFFRDSTTLTPLPVPVPVRLADPSGGPALHTFTLDPGASRCFFHDCTTLTPLPEAIPVRLTDPSGGPIVARSSTVLPCPAVPSGSQLGLHLPSFSTNLVSTAALQDAMVTTTTPGCVSVCTYTRTGCHLATFTRRPGSSLYTLATEPPHAPASAQVSASGQVAASCSCRLLSHQTLLWHHRLGHPSLPRLRGMHSQLLVSGLPRSLPPLPPSPALPCLPCVEERQRAAPHSSFPPMTAPLQTLHMDCRIGLVMEVARTSMIHVAAPHFLWPFAVWGSRAFVRDTSVDKLSARAIPCGPAPSGVSQVDPLPGHATVEVAVGSGAVRGAALGGVVSRGAKPGGAESEGAGSGGAELGGEEPGGAESEGMESGGAKPLGAALSGDPAGASPSLSPQPETLSLQQLREWLVRRARLRSGANGAGGAKVTAGAGGTGGTATAGPGGARTRGTRAARTGGVGGTGAGGTGAGGVGAVDPRAGGAGGTTKPGAAGAGGAGAVGAGAGGTDTGGAGGGGAGVVDPGAGGSRGTVRPRPYFIPRLQQVLGVPSSTSLTPPLLYSPPDQSQPPFLSASPLPAPSPYTKQSGIHTERREPASRLVSPVRTARRVPRSRPSPVPGTHAMALRPSSVPLRVPLPAPPESFLPSLTLTSALVAELLDFAAACRLDYATALIAESESAIPPSVGGECALGTDVLEDRQEDFECLAAAVPHFASMLLAPEGDPDAPDIPTPRSYAQAITGPYSSQWQTAMDAEMASWKSTGTYVDEVPPPGANIVDGMWIFRVKRPPGSPPAFKTRYVARGFSQRQEVHYFQTFSPTLKMTTLRVLLHVAAQHDYELHSLDLSTAFLQGILH
ncbi:unnamed protein product [Closterium sp. NIES-54]